MMRGLNVKQKKIFQQYSQLGQEIETKSKLTPGKKLTSENIWELVTAAGIWRLPISREYGGQGLNWQECIIALDGFFNYFNDIETLTLFISHMSVLFILSRYCTEAIKNQYLQRLMQSEVACLVISEEIIRGHSSNQFFNAENNKIVIYAKKMNNNISFILDERSLSHHLSTSRLIHHELNETNLIIEKESSHSVLYDVINFERLIHGILASKFLSKNLNNNLKIKNS